MTYVPLIPSSGEGDAILGVIFEHEGSSWFIKMKGPSDAVAAQKAAFESFTRSIRFGGKE